MSILTLFVLIPALMLPALWLARNDNQVRGVMVVGSAGSVNMAHNRFHTGSCRR